ncbi:signal peptidase II [Runella sp.]|uniref:signal peptidase II n=1 Tax=Runella sp. TaxID=1960881 RepID=UPI0026129B55|nr:signal peptidase II [Runella sp.]
MMLKKFIRTVLILMIVGVNIGCDQVSKNIVRKNVYFYDNIQLLGKHLTLTKVENSGAFLSLGATLPDFAKTLFLLTLPVIALILGLVFLLFKSDLSNQKLVGLCFIIGGGIGNLFDRWQYGSVTDFLHIQVGIFQTGIFNLADVSIIVGAFIILSGSLIQRKALS